MQPNHIIAVSPEDRLNTAGIVVLKRYPRARPQRPVELLAAKTVSLEGQYAQVRELCEQIDNRLQCDGTARQAGRLYVNVAPFLNGWPLYQALARPSPWGRQLFGIRPEIVRVSEGDKTLPNLKNVHWLPRLCADVSTARAVIAEMLLIPRELSSLSESIARLSAGPRAEDAADPLLDALGLAVWVCDRYSQIGEGGLVNVRYE